MAITHASTATLGAGFNQTGVDNWNASHVGTAGDGGLSFKYNFGTSTANDPASGVLRYNNSTPASVSTIYINETDASSVQVDILLDEFDVGDWIIVSNSDRSKYHVFVVSDMFASGAGIDELPVIYQFGTSNFSDNEVVFLSRSVGEFKYKIGRMYALQTNSVLI